MITVVAEHPTGNCFFFNFWKCECLRTEHGNKDIQYTMDCTVLNTTIKEKDLGLIITSNMKVSEHTVELQRQS